MNGSAPAYLSSYFTHVADVPSRLRLGSSHSDQVIMPSFNLATVGRRAFPVFAANLWNSLPAHLTSSLSLTIFRQHLNTFSFSAFLSWAYYLTFYRRACLLTGKLILSLNKIEINFETAVCHVFAKIQYNKQYFALQYRDLSFRTVRPTHRGTI